MANGVQFLTGFKSAHAPSSLPCPGFIRLVWHGRESALQSQILWTAAIGTDGEPERTPIEASASLKQACWNPVLYRHGNGDLWCFFKAGKSPSSWRGYLLISSDHGHSWSEPFPLPEGILGPTRNPPLELGKGWILCPSSREDRGTGRAVFEYLNQQSGEAFIREAPVTGPADLKIIQPLLIPANDGEFFALCRSNKGRLFLSKSCQGGFEWRELEASQIPNPDSAIAGLAYKQGFLIAHNRSSLDRKRLSLDYFIDTRRVSELAQIEFDDRDVAYPTLSYNEDGSVFCAFSLQQKSIAVQSFEL